ncbi:MAG: response regulator transcription factor [Thermoanaerobaculia bacterium]
MTRVFLIEDHNSVREGLKLLLATEHDMQVVGDADNIFTALPLLPQSRPELVLLDLSLPGSSPVHSVERIRESVPSARILVLTRHREYGYLQQMLESGVEGYALKQSPPDELFLAIRTVMSGKSYLAPTLTGAIVDSIRKHGNDSSTPERKLTRREEQVLRLIAWGKSNKEIAADLGLSVKTVESHKANIKGKLGAQNRSELVRYAAHMGWLEAER